VIPEDLGAELPESESKERSEITKLIAEKVKDGLTRAKRWC
jgi:hypothetical protein